MSSERNTGTVTQTWYGGMDSTNSPIALNENVGTLVRNAAYVGTTRLAPDAGMAELVQLADRIRAIQPLKLPGRQRAISVVFDGSNEYLSVADGSQTGYDIGMGSLTVEFFLKTSATNRTLFVKRDQTNTTNAGWEIGVSATGRLSARISDGTNTVATADDGTVINDNTWRFLAVVFDRTGNLTRYVGGVASGTASPITAVSASVSNSRSFYIAREDKGSPAYMACTLGQVRISSTARSSTEITTSNSSGLAIDVDTLSFYNWEGAPISLTQPFRDKVSAGNHLTQSNLEPADVKDTSLAYMTKTDRNLLVVGTDAGVYAYEYIPATPTVKLLNSVSVTDGKRLNTSEYQQDVWFAGDGSGLLKFYDPESNNFYTAGVSAPVAACTVAAGSVGTAFTKNRYYRYKITFLRHVGARVARSNAGPDSNEVSTGTTGKASMSLSSIPTGASDVTAREIWRDYTEDAKKTWQGYQYVGVINDNTTTTYTDTATDATVVKNDVLEADNFTPPTCQVVSRYLDYLFLAGKTGSPDMVAWSKLQEPEQYPANYALALDEGASSKGEIVAFLATPDSMLAFKNDATYGLVMQSSSVTPFLRSIEDPGRGAYNSHSAAIDKGQVVVICSTGPQFLTSGGPVKAITQPVQQDWNNARSALSDLSEMACVVSYPETDMFVISFGNHLKIFDSLRGAWRERVATSDTTSVYRYTALGVLPMADRADQLFIGIDKNNNPKGSLVVWPSGTKDYTTDVKMTLTSRVIGSGLAADWRACIISNNGSGQISAIMELDGNDVARVDEQDAVDPYLVEWNSFGHRLRFRIETTNCIIDKVDLLGIILPEGRKVK